VFTPFESWRHEHGIHHGAVGNLDRRGTGDIWTLTIDEYKSKQWYVKAWYRLYRNPLFLFGVAPFFLFLILHRFPTRKSTMKEVASYIITNIGILGVGVVFSLLFGFKAYGIVQFIILVFGSSIGVWMFYVQHQFDEVYWEEGKEWNSIDAALKGSTFYKLPLVFEWFSGYIGYHHIHHLNSRIPNYNLKRCYLDNQSLKEVKTINFRESIHLAFLQIYDKKNKRLISFRRLQKGY
jgi:omega-6 fatty acid desaturase (delta-12 desaturase)